jgi:hypothetical protein
MPTSIAQKRDLTPEGGSDNANRPLARGSFTDQQAREHAIAADESANAAARHQLIQLAAYYKAQQRGFAVGGELDDWLAAEGEVDLSLR